jgi:hypothetical protein
LYEVVEWEEDDGVEMSEEAKNAIDEHWEKEK